MLLCLNQHAVRHRSTVHHPDHNTWLRDRGRIVGAIVSRKWGALKSHMGTFAIATVLLAFLNAFLKYYITLLKEHTRQKLTGWCHSQLLREKDMVFYKANKLGPNKIENSDHQMTSDVNLFADLFASVLSQSLKPIVDFVVYSVELSRVQGLATPLTLYGWFAVASMISTVTLPPFGQLAAREQQLDGQFRGVHSELITHCEQIAFLSGEKPEKRHLDFLIANFMTSTPPNPNPNPNPRHLDSKFNLLYEHCIKTINLSFRSEVVRQYLNTMSIYGNNCLITSILLPPGRPTVPQQVLRDSDWPFLGEPAYPPGDGSVCGPREPGSCRHLDLLCLHVEEHGSHIHVDPRPL